MKRFDPWSPNNKILSNKIIILPSSTTSFSFSTALANRSTMRNSDGMSSTSIVTVDSGVSGEGLCAMTDFPAPLLKTQDWIGKPAALGLRFREVGRFRVPIGDGQPTSLVCWVKGVPGQEDETSRIEGDRLVGVWDEEEAAPPSTTSFRGCSWRAESWITVKKRETVWAKR